jgi:hypothetical protein
MLSHEKLDVYQRSIEFLAYALKIAQPDREWNNAKSLLVRVVEMLSKMS